MIRDPFDLHRKNVFITKNLDNKGVTRNTAAHASANAFDMSFNMPKNVPDFSDPYRTLEDKAWQAVRRGGRMTGMLDENELPMYKDKPYAYLPSMRRRSWWRRKRTWAVTIGLVFFLYIMGWLPGSHHETRKVTSAWKWLGLPQDKIVNWDDRRAQVVEAFAESWDAYERYAWGYDEFHPISRSGKKMAPQGLGWIIIDSLDTLILMNQTTRLRHAREWLTETLTWEQNQDVSTFETTIRMLGGLLSAHYLSAEYPDLARIDASGTEKLDEDLYLEKATDLAGRLMSAFESDSGIPYASVNLEQYKGIPSHDDMGASSTAEATSVQLEFKYLAKLTGESEYWRKVEKVMEIIDENGPEDGLVPIYIYATNGEFRGENVRLGSRGDSYYEYLIKQFLQTNRKEHVYLDMWKESLQGMRKHLLTYTEPSGFTIMGERPEGLKGDLLPKMDHLVCFLPGTIALAATDGLPLEEARKLSTWSKQDEEDITLARELMQTCWGMYKFMETGLAAEITFFNIADPPAPATAPHTPPADFDPRPDAPWRDDFIVKTNDRHNLQRPETVESLFYMWRITGDLKYREWGWEMFKSFMNYTAVEEKGGFTSLSNANTVPPTVKDNMESFWLAETLKYMYLLFSPNDLLPLNKIVLNTEAHPFPRFDMGQLFSTGWTRKTPEAREKAQSDKNEGEQAVA